MTRLVIRRTILIRAITSSQSYRWTPESVSTTRSKVSFCLVIVIEPRNTSNMQVHNREYMFNNKTPVKATHRGDSGTGLHESGLSRKSNFDQLFEDGRPPLYKKRSRSNNQSRNSRNNNSVTINRDAAIPNIDHYAMGKTTLKKRDSF